MESQCRRYEDELQKRDENMRRAIADHETSTNEKLVVLSSAVFEMLKDIWFRRLNPKLSLTGPNEVETVAVRT